VRVRRPPTAPCRGHFPERQDGGQDPEGVGRILGDRARPPPPSRRAASPLNLKTYACPPAICRGPGAHLWRPDSEKALNLRSPPPDFSLGQFLGMPADSQTPHPLLLDPEYWQRRLESLGVTPRRLMLFPRPDLARPGIEVIEMRFAGQDGAPLTALLGRPAMEARPRRTHLRLVPEGEELAPDWAVLREGHLDLVMESPGERRLEERVLDLMRLVRCACSLEGVDEESLDLEPEQGGHGPDELLICASLRAQGCS